MRLKLIPSIKISANNIILIVFSFIYFAIVISIRVVIYAMLRFLIYILPFSFKQE